MKTSGLSFFDKFFSGLFSLIGLIFVTVGLVVYYNCTVFYEKALPTEAVIIGFRQTSSDDSPHPILSYSIGGKYYESTLNTYNSGMHRGDRMTIHYLPDNPYRIGNKEADRFWLLFVPFGAVFLLIGLGFCGFRIRSVRKDRWLLAHGDRIVAEIDEISQNPRYSMNGRHPYELRCHYKAPDGTIYDFVSRPLWCNRYELPERGTVPVYIEGLNYKRYVVDVANATCPDDETSEAKA